MRSDPYFTSPRATRLMPAAGIAFVLLAFSIAWSSPLADADLQRLVTQLSDSDFHVREYAEQQLRAAGPRAVPWLEEAARSRDPEVRRRAQRALAHLRRDMTRAEEAWTVQLPGMAQTPPILMGDRVVTATAGREVIAVDTDTAKVVWRRSHPTDGYLLLLAATPGERDARLIVGTNRNLALLNPQDGQRLWTRTDLPGPALAMTADDHRILVLCGSRMVLALDSSNGQTLWQASLAEEEMPRKRDQGAMAIVSDGDAVAIVGSDRVSVLNAHDGRARWSIEMTGLHLRPLLADGSLYVSRSEGTVEAVDVTTGESRWRARLPGPFADPRLVGHAARAHLRLMAQQQNANAEAPRQDVTLVGGISVLDKDRVLVATPMGVAAIERKSGRVAWARLFRDDDMSKGQEILMHLVVMDGEVRRSTQVDNREVLAIMPAVVSRGYVLVSDGRGLVALDASSGEPHWRHEVDGHQLGGLTLLDARHILVSSERVHERGTAQRAANVNATDSREPMLRTIRFLHDGQAAEPDANGRP
ncbi:MAG: PQQ-binding-like beta-propeller repeat protein [Phycisphaeraceae bacterium]|nr:PQQ-binding-like beta-propeller repeat protein [Phycisphaeraceae bacterium]